MSFSHACEIKPFDDRPHEMRFFFRLIQNKISDDAASDIAEAFESNSALTHLMYGRLYRIFSSRARFACGKFISAPNLQRSASRMLCTREITMKFHCNVFMDSLTVG